MSAKYECPQCGRPIVSRRNKHCQYCGAELPEPLRYTKAEIEAQDRLRAEKETEQKTRNEAEKEEDRKHVLDGLYYYGDLD